MNAPALFTLLGPYVLPPPPPVEPEARHAEPQAYGAAPTPSTRPQIAGSAAPRSEPRASDACDATGEVDVHVVRATPSDAPAKAEPAPAK